jgi:cytochrome c-type biogenesis protein CcmF
VGALLVTALLHLLVGGRLGYPFWVASTSAETGWGARAFAALSQFFPGITVALAAFNVTVVVQEFVRGVRARLSSSLKKGERESVPLAFLRLVTKSRRRYGGYVVHLGICGMFLGFVGTAWSIESEVSLSPGQSYDLGGYHLTYRGTRMCPGSAHCSLEENQVRDRRMIFADLDVSRGGRPLGRLTPAKFIYTSPEQVTSEVGLLRGFRDDLYTVLAVADPTTKRATFSLHVNPFVSFIWLGLGILMLGCTVSLWPEVGNERVRVASYVQALASVSAGVLFALYLSLTVAQPFAAPLARNLPRSSGVTP